MLYFIAWLIGVGMAGGTMYFAWKKGWVADVDAAVRDKVDEIHDDLGEIWVDVEGLKDVTVDNMDDALKAIRDKFMEVG